MFQIVRQLCKSLQVDDSKTSIAELLDNVSTAGMIIVRCQVQFRRLPSTRHSRTLSSNPEELERLKYDAKNGPPTGILLLFMTFPGRLP